MTAAVRELRCQVEVHIESIMAMEEMLFIKHVNEYKLNQLDTACTLAHGLITPVLTLVSRAYCSRGSGPFVYPTSELNGDTSMHVAKQTIHVTVTITTCTLHQGAQSIKERPYYNTLLSRKMP